MKKLISIYLSICLLVSASNIIYAQNSEEKDYKSLFLHAGVEVPQGAVFKEILITDSKNEDEYSTVEMLVEDSEGVSETVLFLYKMEAGTEQMVNLKDAMTILQGGVNSAKASGTVTLSTVTATGYYYKVTKANSIYLYRPYKLSFSSSTRKTNLSVSYEIQGERYSAGLVDQGTDGSFVITKGSITANAGTTYSKESTSPYYYYLYGFYYSPYHRIWVNDYYASLDTSSLVI